MYILNSFVLSLLISFAVISEVSSSTLLCTFSMTQYNFIGTIYVCEATVSELNIENVTSVFGDHELGKSHFDVQGLFIQQQNVTFVPTNIEAFFPNLTALNFHYNSITKITNNHLNPFPRLEYLSFLHSPITTLDSNLLSGLNYLKYINFRSNKLTFIGEDVILNLSSNLVCVDFGYNPCAYMNMQACETGQLDNLKINLIYRCNINVSTQDLENRNRQLEAQVVYLGTRIESMNTTIAELKETNLRQETRITALENWRLNLSFCVA